MFVGIASTRGLNEEVEAIHAATQRSIARSIEAKQKEPRLYLRFNGSHPL